MSGNVVTRTNSEEKRKKAEERREEYLSKRSNKNNNDMVISVVGEDIESGKTFGKAMIPSNGVINKISAKLPRVSGAMTLKVISELDAHTREDSFQVTGGLTTLQESIKITAGVILRFSLEFDQEEEFEEVFISGTIKTN